MLKKLMLMVTVILLPSLAFAAGGYFQADEVGNYEHPWGQYFETKDVASTDDILDWPQNPGWPQRVSTHGNFSPSRGNCLADINGDGTLEVVASSNNQVHVLDYYGEYLSGWPATTINVAQGAPSVGDVDNDGAMEIVQGTRGLVDGGRLYMFEADGTVSAGFPVNFNDQNVAAAPALYDLDSDGTMEIVVGTRDYPKGHLRVVDHDGSEWGGNWPVLLDHVPTGTAAIADIDNDGEPEIAYMSYNSIYLVNVDGTALDGFPWTCPWGNFSYQSIALHDINDDGYLELMCANHKDGSSAFILDYQGNVLPGWPYYFSRWTYSPPSIANIDDDDDVEIVVGVSGGFSYPTDNLYAFDTDGTVLPGFPVVIQGSAEGPTGIGDTESNGDMYLAFDNNTVDQQYLGFIHVCDNAGNLDPDYPLRPTGFTYMNGIQLADLDRNGVMEFVNISSYDYAYINVWSQRDFYGDHPVEWETYHANNHRTGLYNPMGGNDLPGHFNLVGPDSGSTVSPEAILEWEASIDPDGDNVEYWVVIDDEVNLENPDVISAGMETSISIADLELEPNVTYYWYVTADDGNCSWVTASNQKFWSFTIGGAGCVDIAMEPDNEPIIVPPGGSFGYTGFLTNNTSEPLVTDAWVGVIYLGVFYQLNYFPGTNPIQPGQTLSTHVVQNVPGYAPAGDYIYMAYSGDYPEPCDSAFFNFEVAEPAIASSNQGWTLEGGWITDGDTPTEFSILGNHPNPFNAQTSITFEIPTATDVNLTVFNLSGQKVATLIDGNREAGYHIANWDASNYSSGIYFYKLTAGNNVFTKRMTLVK
ncbi:MAG: T9SS type A sorting domain-containing protein [candidate division Zixibacteria bacterium]|nr:T9SS type A sorting domain-containing protein [candidate division Zixibacteria bacterium]